MTVSWPCTEKLLTKVFHEFYQGLSWICNQCIHTGFNKKATIHFVFRFVQISKLPTCFCSKCMVHRRSSSLSICWTWFDGPVQVIFQRFIKHHSIGSSLRQIAWQSLKVTFCIKKSFYDNTCNTGSDHVISIETNSWITQTYKTITQECKSSHHLFYIFLECHLFYIFLECSSVSYNERNNEKLNNLWITTEFINIFKRCKNMFASWW